MLCACARTRRRLRMPRVENDVLAVCPLAVAGAVAAGFRPRIAWLAVAALMPAVVYRAATTPQSPPVVTLSTWKAGLWARDHVNRACVDYLVGERLHRLLAAPRRPRQPARRAAIRRSRDLRHKAITHAGSRSRSCLTPSSTIRPASRRRCSAGPRPLRGSTLRSSSNGRERRCARQIDATACGETRSFRIALFRRLLCPASVPRIRGRP